MAGIKVLRRITNPQLHPEIKAGNYTECVIWQEDPLGLSLEGWGDRVEAREKNDELPSMHGYGFRSTSIDGKVFDFTYANEDDYKDGVVAFASPENIMSMLQAAIEAA